MFFYAMLDFLNLELLNEYKSVLMVGLSGVYALTTLVLWMLNHRSQLLARQALDEMKRSHEEELRPYIGLHPEINAQGWFILTLQNFGKTSAFQIKLSFTKNYIARSGNKEPELLKDLGIGHEIKSLGPQSALTEIINFRSYEFWELNRGQRTLKAVLTYRDAQGKSYREDIEYDLHPLFKRKNLVYPALKTTLENTERECDRFKRHLEQLSRS